MISMKTIGRTVSVVIFALVVSAPFSQMSAQTVEAAPKVIVAPPNQKIRTGQKKGRAANETAAEKSIAVDAKVNISLCVSAGRLKINGWERSEIRAFVGGGGELGFKVLQKNKQNNAVWVMVTGFDAAKNPEVSSEECLAGDDIEIDVPRGATVNVKGRTSEVTIAMVRKVDVKNVGGDISLNNIAEGINAATYEGDVTVENSGGAISLESSNGNIVAFDAAPSEIGDIFKAKTASGAIILQQIAHRQTEISSNTGSIKFIGEFQSGGQYDFRTTNGAISLVIPEKTSCKVAASYGFGAFNSDLPLSNLKKNPNPNSRSQSLTAAMGGGEANLVLTTYSGAIRIKKQ